MSDLDFDELDKAVNSLMGSKAETPQKSEESPSAPQAEENQEVAEEQTPVDEQPSEASEAAEQTPAEPVAVQPPAVRRSSGRFMDVMHQSSNMRPGQGVAPRMAGVPASRTGTTIAPPATEVSTASVDTPVEVNHTEPTPEEVPVVDHSTNTSDDSASSPFLPDAKVDKRPLGQNTDAPLDEDDPVADGKDAQLTPESAEVDVLPEELQSDLIAIEMDDPTELDETIETTPETEAEPSVQPITQPIDPVTQHAGAAQPPMSIAQQYKETPSTGDQTNGAIYDTEQYHKPVGQPVKQKSYWLLIIIVVLVLALVGAGGVAYYMLAMN